MRLNYALKFAIPTFLSRKSSCINTLSPPRLHWLRRLGQTAFVAIIIAQATITALGGIISLQTCWPD
jgi:hypothetical protein